MTVDVLVADITTLAVDAIVNAADPRLLGGGGVDGAIHRAAGPALLEACRALPADANGVRCPAGEVRLTAGFALPARYVIHTVGPVWRGGQQGEPTLLAACYRNALQLALDRKLRSVAFPAISCGVYGYPPEAAAGIATRSIREVLAQAASMQITLCGHDPAMAAVLRQALNAA